MEETEHHGDFWGGIIWRLQNSVSTPLAPFLIVRELLINQCSRKIGASSIYEAKFFKEISMPSKEIVWKIPEDLYRELEWAKKEFDYPNLIALVSQAVQRFLAEAKQDAWLKQFRHLQKLVRSSGGFGLGETKDEVITKLRRQRLQIFEEEYAHLYR